MHSVSNLHAGRQDIHLESGKTHYRGTCCMARRRVLVIYETLDGHGGPPEPSSHLSTGHPSTEWAEHVASCILHLHGSTGQPASRHPVKRQGIHWQSGRSM